jgi:hypothetical protein
MTHRLPHDAVAETPSGDHHAAIADLQRTVADLKARLEKLEQPPPEWVPLKTAAHDSGIEYETLRTWAVAGLIEARREGGRWLVNVVGLRARQGRLASRLSGAKLPTSAQS